MERFNHNGIDYWIIIDEAVDVTTGQGGFIAYVNAQQPGALLRGESVKDNENRTVFFGSYGVALLAAQEAIQGL